MKKSITLLIAMLFGLSAFSAKPIFSITKWDEGRHGFKNVSTILTVNDLGQEGWVIECNSPGFEPCRRPMGGQSADLDDVDLTQGEFLLDLADELWNEGHKSGYESKLVQVNGEGFTRKYIVEWTCIDRIIYMNVTRIDINL